MKRTPEAFFESHHVPSLVDESAWLLGVSGAAAVRGGFSWLAYISFEPYVRRWWPHTLVSWTRLLAGRARDALVGRDVLVGTLMGIASAGLMLIPFEVMRRHPPLRYLLPALDALHTSIVFGSMAISAVLNGLLVSLGVIAILALFRVIQRRTWIALTALALTVPLFAFSTSLIDIVFAPALALLGLVVLLRIGVLVFVTMHIVMVLLTWLPLTLDADAWYFDHSMMVLLTIGAPATCGFLVALAGRPAFGVMTRNPS